jgi:hypothetical protein
LPTSTCPIDNIAPRTGPTGQRGHPPIRSPSSTAELVIGSRAIGSSVARRRRREQRAPRAGSQRPTQESATLNTGHHPTAEVDNAAQEPGDREPATRFPSAPRAPIRVR